MSLTKHGILNIAIDITKDAAKGGVSTPPLDVVLRKIYEVLNELNEEVKKEE